MIICGKQTTDGDTAQVGAEMAEFLDIDHCSNVTEVLDIKDSYITVRMNLETSVQVQKMKMPCLICVDKDINTPRLPSYKRKRDLNGNETIKTLTLDDFKNKNEKQYGLSGSPTQVDKIFPPEKNDNKEIFQGTPEEESECIFTLLKQKKFI